MSTPTQSSTFDIVLEKSLEIKPPSELLVIFDESAYEYQHQLVEACLRRGVRPTCIFVPKPLQLAYSKIGDEGVAPLPFVMSSALRATKYAVTLLSVDKELTPFRGEVLKSERANDCRLLHVPGVSSEIIDLVGASPFDEIEAAAHSLAIAVGNGRSFTLTTVTSSGSECVLRGTLSGWDNEPFISSGIVSPGGWANLPPGEVFFCPEPAGLNGQVCINGSIPDVLLRHGEEVMLNIEKGRLVSWEGDPSSPAIRYLNDLRQIWQERDVGWNMIAEIGIGLNPAISRLMGNSLFDEKASGTAHVALGDNTCFGHNNESFIHDDLVFHQPTFLVDSTMLIEKGKLVAQRPAKENTDEDWEFDNIPPNALLLLRYHKYHSGVKDIFCRRLQTGSRVSLLPLRSGDCAEQLNRICDVIGRSPGISRAVLERELDLERTPGQLSRNLAFLRHYRVIKIEA